MLNETQFRILSLILRNSDLHVTSIAKELRLSAMAVSKAVRDMGKKGFVTTITIGKSKVVRVNLNKEHLEYYAIAEKLHQTKHKLLTLLQKADIDFAIIHPIGCLVVASKPIRILGATIISPSSFTSNYKKYERFLKGERIIVNPYNFWKMMIP